jgi:hypothetical protein
MGNVPAVLLRYRRHARQVSKLEKAKIRTEAFILRRRGFDVIFPDADPALLSAFHRMQDFQPCADVHELEHVGRLLARLARCPEQALRERMLRHWRAACRRSAHLGPAAYRIYLHFAPEFAVADSSDDPALRAACAARLRSNRQFGRRLRRLTS